MITSRSSLGTVVAQGWILMFLVLICVFLTEFVNSVVAGDLTMFRSEEASKAMRGMVILMLLHAFVPMLVITLNGRWFRWLVVAITAGLTVIMIAHEVAHLMMGNKPFGFFHLLDFAHHGLGIWVVTVATRWAKETP